MVPLFVVHRPARTAARRLSVCALLAALVSAVPLQAGEISGFSPLAIEQVSITRQLAMLRAICDQGDVGIVDGLASCTVCPSYTSDADAAVSGLQIGNVIEGNFTRGNVPEVLVDLDGCEPHARLGGGAVILERIGKGWRRVFYRAGFRPTQCIRFRTRDQVQALACNIVDFSHGVQLGELDWIELKDGVFHSTTLLSWLDNIQTNPAHLLSVFPYNFMTADFNHDGRVDLRVKFRLRDERAPQQYDGMIDAIDAGYELSEPRTLQLLYLFDGMRLALAPESAAAKQSIDALLKTYQSGK